MSLCKHAKRAVDNGDALVCNVCSCVQDKDGGWVHQASKLGHNGIKITDGIMWPEFLERTQMDRKIQGRMTHIEDVVKTKRGERKEGSGRANDHT